MHLLTFLPFFSVFTMCMLHPQTQKRPEAHLLWFLEGYCFILGMFPALMASKFLFTLYFIFDYFSSTLGLPNVFVEAVFPRTWNLAF